jgi:hypothetical protein
MAQTDIFGLENVSKYIELTKFSKWTIFNVNTNGNTIPLFDCNDSNSNSNAVEMFESIAGILNNYTTYKIVCYNDVEMILDKAGNEKPKATNKKTGKCSITFAISQNNNFNSKGSNDIQQHNNNVDLASFRKEIIKEISEQNEKNEILSEIRALKLKFAELDEEDDLEDEPEKVNGSIAGIDPQQITSILGLVNMFKNTPNPSLNGIDENPTTPDQSVQRININKALRILLKNDPQLDTDLLKLAELSETKKDTFKMLITTLRSM